MKSPMLPPGPPTPHGGERLAVLLPGVGAVATTFVAGCAALRRGVGSAAGSLTQLGSIEHGGAERSVGELADLAPIADLAFGGWDIYEGSAWEAASRSAVLGDRDMEAAREDLEALEPMSAVFDRRFVRNLDGPNVKKGGLEDGARRRR